MVPSGVVAKSSSLSDPPPARALLASKAVRGAIVEGNTQQLFWSYRCVYALIVLCCYVLYRVCDVNAAVRRVDITSRGGFVCLHAHRSQVGLVRASADASGINEQRRLAYISRHSSHARDVHARNTSALCAIVHTMSSHRHSQSIFLPASEQKLARRTVAWLIVYSGD
jgi:hypothetical protein